MRPVEYGEIDAKNAKLTEQKAGSAHPTDGNETSVARKEYRLWLNEEDLL